jgi:hypothetical protein
MERRMSDEQISAGQQRGVSPVVYIIALATFTLHLAFYEGFGIFRDELYFLACADHLDWGYVDQPPAVAVVAWIAKNLLGGSLLAVRIVPILFASLQVLLAGITVRAMGGGRFAQALAALCVMSAPIYFGSYLNTDIFLTVGWAACAWVAVRIFAGGDPKLWLLFGLFAGLTLQGKHAMVFFGVALLLGMLLGRQRGQFTNRWIWLGAGLTCLIASPNLIWEYTHNWATYELLSNIAASDKNVVLGPGEFLLSNVLFLAPLTAPVWGAGLLWCLFASGGRRFRALGWTWVLAYLCFVLLHGKGYYLAPIYSTLFCAGAVAIEAMLARTRRPQWRTAAQGSIATAAVLGCMALWPFAMPMMPVEKFIAYEEALGVTPPRTETMRLEKLPQQYADMFGWPQMAAAVAKAYDSIPADQRRGCGIFAQNYGEAGAVDYFGKQYGLPPVLSGHQSYWFWGPRGYSGECLVVVGDNRKRLEELFNNVVLAGETNHPYAIPYENHLAIWIVHRPRFGTLQDLWPSLKKWI